MPKERGIRGEPVSPKEFLGGNCAMIPKYQRQYSWDLERAHSLVKDIAQAAQKLPSEPDHWMGVLIAQRLEDRQMCPLGQSDPYNHQCREIIDGQQRLTTIALWHLALHHHAKLVGDTIDVNDDFPFPTLWLQEVNDAELKAIQSGRDVSSEPSPMYRVYSYFRFILWMGTDSILSDDPIKPPRINAAGASLTDRFQKHLDKSAQDDEPLTRSAKAELDLLLEATWDHLELTVLNTTDRDQDSASIYDTLNGQRTELTQFDHLRNYCFQSVPRDATDDLFDHWEPAQAKLYDLAPGSAGSEFLYEYLISIGESSATGFGLRRTFPTFRQYIRSVRWPTETAEQWVTDEFPNAVDRFIYARKPVGPLRRSGVPKKLDVSAKRSLFRIRRISKAATPLIMHLLDRASMDATHDLAITGDEFKECLVLVEGILLFRPVLGDKLTFVKPWLIRFIPKIQEDCRTDGDTSAGQKLIDLLLKECVSWKRLKPQLDNGWRNEDNEGIYSILGSSGCLALLDALEHQMSGDRSHDMLDRHGDFEADPFSIEHIFPQSDKRWEQELSRKQFADLRPQREQLGNLAPLPIEINRKILNAPFLDKCEQLKEMDLPPLRLNTWIDNDTWLKTDVSNRTGELLNVMEQRWFAT